MCTHTAHVKNNEPIHILTICFHYDNYRTATLSFSLHPAIPLLDRGGILCQEVSVITSSLTMISMQPCFGSKYFSNFFMLSSCPGSICKFLTQRKNVSIFLQSRPCLGNHSLECVCRVNWFLHPSRQCRHGAGR